MSMSSLAEISKVSSVADAELREVLSDEQVRPIDRYWRAANYLSVGQIYLLDNPLLRDPLTAQPHEPDVSALVRLCDVHDIALATNPASAGALMLWLREQVQAAEEAQTEEAQP